MVALKSKCGKKTISIRDALALWKFWELGNFLYQQIFKVETWQGCAVYINAKL